jgi:carbon monoxide dehydrogenase subunit G
VSIGVGPFRAAYLVEAELFPIEPPHSLCIVGGADGRFGKSRGEAYVRFEPADGGTRVRYRYAIRIGGPVGRVGGPLLQKVANALIAKFFRSLAAAQAEPAGT